MTAASRYSPKEAIKLLRQVAELLSRRRVFRRRFPAKYGSAQLYVTPECGLRYLRGNLESVDPMLLDLAAELVQPGAVVWDVGANLGLFSFAAAGLAGVDGQIFALEPDTYLVGLLRRSARLKNAHAAPVNVIPCAVADTMSLATFHIVQRARAANYLAGHGASQTGGVRETQRVLTITLDWLATQIPTPDVIKIDVEGADLRVLYGAEELLRAKKPDLVCEVYEAIADDFTAFLSDLGYTLFDGNVPRETRRPISRAVYSTLAISKHKASLHRKSI
ncbi:methyltransferase, FkbM family domain protein [Acidisarcina polymorpha]|uniref:Methyltransferase, FkbM family domain protein n=1 Tax=Acidisarcina polymorpha TaxID=2211140 RepID=A0A2Z5G3L1_9BACT|nr:FkbM family methyltransferase [Acidisarcina polymorpha]AXC13215.1 methyltransferase, FkbM family domain protein [Acidisarcina polymorpha]